MTSPPKTDRSPSVGNRLRQRRLAMRLTLREVSERAGITESYLSQIERDRVTVGVDVLQRVAEPLRLPLSNLFADSSNETSPVSRFKDMVGASFGVGGSKMRLTPQSFDHLEVLIGVFEPGGSTGLVPYNHGESDELLVVLEGDVVVHLDGNEHELGTLDSIWYSSAKMHGLTEATGQRPAKVLWAISPPSY